MTTNRRTLIDKYRRRRSRRGAAMVEASFVVGVLVVFWGLMQWTRQSYSDKLDQMGTTRSNSSYYAAHDCEKGDATAVLGGASPEQHVESVQQLAALEEIPVLGR